MHDDFGWKNQTTRYTYILLRHWLYEWFSQFHSCGTYSVLSLSPSNNTIKWWKYIALATRPRLSEHITSIFFLNSAKSGMQEGWLTGKGFGSGTCHVYRKYLNFINKMVSKFHCTKTTSWSDSMFVLWIAQFLHLDFTFWSDFQLK